MSEAPRSRFLWGDDLAPPAGYWITQVCRDCQHCVRVQADTRCISTDHRHCNQCGHCESMHLVTGETPRYARESIQIWEDNQRVDWRQAVPGRFVEPSMTTWGQPMLEPQLWVGGQRAHAPTKERFNGIQNAPDFPVKPKGGMWTSTYIPNRGSGWTEWCVTEDYGVPQGGWASWLLYPMRDLQVLHINTYDDLKAIVESEYGVDQPWRSTIFDGNPRWLNFERLSEAYDVIHLTEEGQWATRLSHPHNLYGWDTESCLWLHWGGIDWDKTQSLGTVRWSQSGPVKPDPPKAKRLRGPRRRL